MAVSVPRRAESPTGARKRALVGDAVADAIEASARKTALTSALESALSDSMADVSTFCTFAAANLDWAAKPLLEALGQGASGPIRTRAWILRNGGQIKRGTRGFAVSAWGGYAFTLASATRSYGSFGVESGVAPAEALADAEALTGSPIAARILCALRGYQLEPYADPSLTVESLNSALALARGVAWQTATCLACDGHGCLLCSCDDDANRQPMLDYSPPVETAKRIGRPPSTLADPSQIRDALERVTHAEAELAAARAELRATLIAANRSGASLQRIAEVSGVSRQRIHQIVSKP